MAWDRGRAGTSSDMAYREIDRKGDAASQGAGPQLQRCFGAGARKERGVVLGSEIRLLGQWLWERERLGAKELFVCSSSVMTWRIWAAPGPAVSRCRAHRLGHVKACLFKAHCPLWYSPQSGSGKGGSRQDLDLLFPS